MDRILVVDDDRLILEHISELLGEAGYDVAFVSNPGFALKRLQDEEFSLLLLDVFMPGISGLELLKQIRENKKLEQLPVIMMTGEGDEQLLSRCFQAGATDYIDKPVNETVLRSRVEAIIRDIHRRNELQQQHDSILEQKTEIEKQKSLQYRLRSLSAQMNPHFIFNSISSIQYFIFDENRENTLAYLSSLSSLFRQALYNSERDLITIEEEMDFITRYLELESQRMKGKLSFKITADKKLDVQDTLIPPMIVQPYIENAIHHGITPKNGNGNIEISFRAVESEPVIQCVISDNGVGIDRDSESTIRSEKPRHKSRGMSITKTRLELLNSIYENKFSVTIDKGHGNDPGHPGTSVVLNIPLLSY